MTRIAVAGAAHPHVDYVVDEISRSQNLQLVAVADPVRELAEKWAAPHGAPVFTDHRRMLDAVRPDVVVTAGVYGDRGRTVLDALHAGCHVLADKPLCTTPDELDAIAAATHRGGRHVVLMLEKRYYPETLAALELVRAGVLGEITGVLSSGPHKLNRAARPGWFFERARYGGILGDLAVHDIDAALYFTGLTAGTVAGSVAGTTPGTADFAPYGVATLAAPDVLVTAEVSWMTPAASAVHGDYRMRLVGTRGTAELLWARRRLVVTTDDEATHDVALPEGFRPAQLPLRALASGEEPDISTRQSLLATRLALLAQQSADTGGTRIPWSATTAAVPDTSA
ncbi:Gfo/Idh/MocA family protein [Streptomyces sp. NPDC020917]|uniref:Gfo/Idh/MocA family protein n=1 Tax=Streptomyces sp. NPDC020917 TaxID=3365102 RepID=UPI0037A1D303